MIPYKLSPIERSVLLTLDKPRRSSEIPPMIRYVRRKDFEDWLDPILYRLEAAGYIKKQGLKWLRP